MTAEHPPTTTVVGAAVEPPADPRPAWERVAYTWLEREVDGGQQVNPTAPAAEVSVSPRLASELVRVLRAQRQRDPALAELRGRLVRDKITDAYLVRELRGGATLEAAELARQVGTTTRVARQWLHTLRAVRSGDPRLALLRAQPASHGQPPKAACGVADRLRRRRPAEPGAGRPAAGQSAGAHRAGVANPRDRPWRAPRPGTAGPRGRRRPRLHLPDLGGLARRGADQHPRITQLWEVAERDGGQHLDAPAIARMLGIPAGRVRQVLRPLRTQQRHAADQQTPREQPVPLVAGEGRLGWMDHAACKGLPTERSYLRPNRFPEPGAYRQDRELAERASATSPAGSWPTAPALEPAFAQLNRGAVPRARGHTGTPAVRLRRAEEIETLGYQVVADMNRESRPSGPACGIARSPAAPSAQQLAAERASRPVRRQAERAGRHERARTERADRAARPHHQVSYRDER